MKNNLYNSCNNKVRDWYKSKSVKQAIKNGYYLDKENGDIIPEDINCDRERLQLLDFDITNANLDCGLEGDLGNDLDFLNIDNDSAIETTKEPEVRNPVEKRKREKRVNYVVYFDDDDNEKENEDKDDDFEFGRHSKKKPKKKNEENNRNKKVDWQVADIYTVNNVISTTLFLLALLEKYIDSRVNDEFLKREFKEGKELKNEYFQMMSSFMIYVHLCNIFCGVRMTSRWNIKISNAYVYKYNEKNINAQTGIQSVSDTFMEQQLQKETGKIIGEKIIKYVSNDDFMSGVRFTLGYHGMKQINKAYRTYFLDDITASNALDHADEILDIVREMHLIEDVSFQLFMKRLRDDNSKKTEFLHKICSEIIYKKIYYNAIDQESSSQSGIQNGKNNENVFHLKIQKLSDLQKKIILFIDDEYNTEERFENMKSELSNIKIWGKHELKDILIFINIFSLYHFRNNGFMEKIEKIILYLKNDIMGQLSNYEIVKIFRKNARILLFLSEERMIIFDKRNVILCLNNNIHLYLSPELKNILELHKNRQIVINDGNREIVNEKRRIGENDNVICELIRTDSIEEFTNYIKTKNVYLNSCIPKSCYETNQMLLGNSEVTLIKYAAHFGSIKIFRYLRERISDIDFSILEFAIHGRNEEIINEIIDLVKIPSDLQIKNIFKLMIGCSEFDSLQYIIEKKFNGDIMKYNNLFMKYSLKYRNYINIKSENLCSSETLNMLFKYDCYAIIEKLLKDYEIDWRQFWDTALSFSCYDLIVFIENVNKNYFDKIVDDVVLNNFKKRIATGKLIENIVKKVETFFNIFNSGINTKAKYIELFKGEQIKDDDVYLQFLSLKNEGESDEEILQNFIMLYAPTQGFTFHQKVKKGDIPPDILTDIFFISNDDINKQAVIQISNLSYTPQPRDVEIINDEIYMYGTDFAWHFIVQLQQQDDNEPPNAKPPSSDNNSCLID